MPAALATASSATGWNLRGAAGRERRETAPRTAEGADSEVVALFQCEGTAGPRPERPLRPRHGSPCVSAGCRSWWPSSPSRHSPAMGGAEELRLPLRRHVPTLFHNRQRPAPHGVRVRVTGAPAQGRPLLLLSNHCSWLDICVLGSLFPLFYRGQERSGGLAGHRPSGRAPAHGLRGPPEAERHRRGQSRDRRAAWRG